MLKYTTVILFYFILTTGLLFMDLYTHVPFAIYLTIIITLIILLTYGSANIQSNFYTTAICKGNSSSQIALTFDDGPITEKTEAILDILKLNNINATFFCVGANVSKNPDILKRINNEGHLIGNHSFSHHTLFDLFSKSRMVKEIKNTNNLIYNLIGNYPIYFRPPYGVTTPVLANAIEATKMTTIGWNIRSFDTISKSNEKLLTTIKNKIKPGAIILLHDSSEITVSTIQDIINLIHKQGLQIVRLDHLINIPPYV